MASSFAVRAFAALALLAPALGAEARPLICKMQVTVDPPALEVGVGQARVRVATDGATPRLVTSSGELRDLRPEGPSAFVADYYPADPDDPKVAVVAAVLDSGACGFAAVRVAGRATARAGGPVALLLHPAEAPADLDADVQVHVFALDESGRPWTGSAPALAVSNGTISPPDPAGAGAWRARWRAVPQEGRTASVAASLAGGSTFTATLERAAGAVAALRIEFDRPTAAPGDPKPVTVTVQARDAAGNLTDAEVAIESDLGGIGELVRVEQGVYRAPLQVAPALRGDRSITLEARAGAISSQAVLPLAPGPSESVSIVAPESVPADGRTVRQVSVEVLDAFGNPVEDEKLATESALAELGAPLNVAPGRWIFSYRARRVQRDDDDVVTVRAGTVTATRTILLVAPTPRVSIASLVGGVLQSGSFGFALAGDVAVWTRLGSEQVGLALDAAWWSLSSSGSTSTATGSFGYGDKRNYVPVVLYLAWRRPVGASSMLWVMAGGGAAWVEASSSLSGQTTVSQSGWAPAVSVAASYGMRAGPGFPFVELRGGWIGNPSLGTLSGSAVPVLLFLGYRFDAG